MQLRIGHKLGVALGLLTILAVGLSIFAFWQSRMQRRQTAEIERSWDFAFQARNLSRSVEHTAVVANSVFASDGKAEIQEKLKFLRTALDQLKFASEAFLKRAGGRISDDQKTRLALSVQEFISYENETVELGLTVSPKAALIQANDDATIKNREKIIDEMEHLAQATLDRLSSERGANEKKSERNEALMIMIPAVAILIGLLVAIWIILTQIREPLAKIVAAMQHVAEGELDTEIPFVEKQDEIGEIAHALVVFKDAATAKIQRDAEIEEERRRSEEERRIAAEEAIQHERELVSASIGAGLAKLSAKDLTFRLTNDLPEAYLRLQNDFNAAIDQLEAALADVVDGAQAIEVGVEQIAGAAADLSRRTEQQAAGLEETTAALATITTTVKRSAEGASHASAIVGTTKLEAENSGEIASKAVDAIRRIEKSSQEIGNIIGVINEITFQTNLLALNAGVEAARAGEAGKGFAVVASEVRALAQRSAEAAKEIKSLIAASSSEVGAGVELVGQTVNALARIVFQVVAIDKVVGEIAGGSREQATSLEEINVAIGEMDQHTQKNAAMVEETTAATSELQRETVELVHAVGSFRIARGGRGKGTGSAVQGARKSNSVTALKIAAGAGDGSAVRKSSFKPQESSWDEF
jgi:methyl-accepting chemotaxis protein